MDNTFIPSEYEYLNIDNITTVDKPISLIDITVNEDETFCIFPEKIISHNCKSMMRVLTYKAAKAGCTILFSNHVYDDPGAMFPTLIKNQSGGKGPVYLASLLIQLLQKTEKAEKAGGEILPEANKVSGVSMKALTVKNRFIPPFLETNISLNFKTGVDRMSGIIDMAVAHGVINQSGPTYSLLDGTKLGFRSKWENDPKIIKSILIELDKKIQVAYAYSRDSEINELETEIDQL